MGTPHKHADIIKAWADGEEIEWRYASKENWEDLTVKHPVFDAIFEFRIKPKRVKKEGWVNVYSQSSACICPTKETADKHAAPHRKACIRIEWEEEE